MHYNHMGCSTGFIKPLIALIVHINCRHTHMHIHTKTQGGKVKSLLEREIV